ncbi:hypothetical protein [Mesorhizobium sp. M4B.F.Ca.ET.211.01.1.1]|uniref:hypothetical protein n=1 Tax=unclassified Mesorhizobium TaxID=325217 RepID=UPI0032AFD456
MTVEIAEEMVQPRREPAREVRCCQPALAIIANAVGEHAAELAEHVVPPKPHIGEAMNIAVALPGLARIFLRQPAQIVRQAGSLEQRKISGVRHDSLLW